MTSIGFSYCKNLESVNLTGCGELTSINLAGSGIKSVDLSPCPKVTSIYFCDCKNLESVNLTGYSALTEIGSNAFKDCVALKEVNLTGCSALTKIGYYAFSGCVEAVVKLPASIGKIERQAFGYNDTTYCKEVHVPNETIKGLVKDSGYPAGYPEDRIKMY